MAVWTLWDHTAVSAEEALSSTASQNCVKVQCSSLLFVSIIIYCDDILYFWYCHLSSVFQFQSGPLFFRYQWVQALFWTTLRPQVWQHRGVLPVQLHSWFQAVQWWQKLSRWARFSSTETLILSSRGQFAETVKYFCPLTCKHLNQLYYLCMFADRYEWVWWQPL